MSRCVRQVENARVPATWRGGGGAGATDSGRGSTRPIVRLRAARPGRDADTKLILVFLKAISICRPPN